MVEPYLRRSPLAHRGLPARVGPTAEAGVLLAERAHRSQVNLRGEPATAFLDAVRAATGLALPTAPNTTTPAGDLKALWLGPNEWLIVGPDGRQSELVARLRQALAEQHAAVVDVSEARTVIRLAGPRVRELMAKATPLDLYPRAFKAGQCAQSSFAKAVMILDQVDDAPTYEVYVQNSFADYVWVWIEQAAAHYAIAIVE